MLKALFSLSGPSLGFTSTGFYDDQNFNGNLSEQLPCGKTNILSILPLTQTNYSFLITQHVTMSEYLLTEIISDINNLILDYLTMEGYPLAAAKFSKEANLSPRQEDPAIKARQQIRNSIHQGNIQEAIEALNELDPQVCFLLSEFSRHTLAR